MFINNMTNYNKHFAKSKLAKESYTFSVAYDFWVETLFERCMRLFVWKNTGDVPPHEIEAMLLLGGDCGVTKKYKRKISVFGGQYSGTPTQYYDIFEDYSIHSPLFAGTFKVGKEIEVIWNNSCRNSIFPLVHRYAVMLAHLEVSFINTLINGRDSGGIPIASTETAKKSIEAYRNSLCNGKVMPIQDPAFSGVEFIGVDKNTVLNVKELMEARQNLLNAFYNDIGVKTAHEKKGNMIVEEVNANDTMLLLNLQDMLNSRKEGAERVNKLFGTNWEVDVAEELKYDEEDDSYGIQPERAMESERTDDADVRN